MPPLPRRSTHVEGLIKWLLAYVKLKARKALFLSFFIPKIIPTGLTRARRRKNTSPDCACLLMFCRSARSLGDANLLS